MKIVKLTIISLFFLLNFTLVTHANAANGCQEVGQCINNQKCKCRFDDTSGRACEIVDNLYLSAEPCGSASLGGVKPPDAIKSLNREAGGIGIIYFASRIFKFLTIIAGVWVMFNFIQSGYTFITASGNVQAYQTVRDQLTWSIVGLLLIAVAYTFAGLFGLIFFGDASYIINPVIQGAIN